MEDINKISQEELAERLGLKPINLINKEPYNLISEATNLNQGDLITLKGSSKGLYPFEKLKTYEVIGVDGYNGGVAVRMGRLTKFISKKDVEENFIKRKSETENMKLSAEYFNTPDIQEEDNVDDELIEQYQEMKKKIKKNKPTEMENVDLSKIEYNKVFYFKFHRKQISPVPTVMLLNRIAEQEYQIFNLGKVSVYTHKHEGEIIEGVLEFREANEEELNLFKSAFSKDNQGTAEISRKNKTDLTEEEYETNLIELKRAALNLMGISMDHETVKTIVKVFNVIENKLGDTTLRDIMQYLVKEEEKEPESAGEIPPKRRPKPTAKRKLTKGL